jgi:hypothetical protein
MTIHNISHYNEVQKLLRASGGQRKTVKIKVKAVSHKEGTGSVFELSTSSHLYLYLLLELDLTEKTQGRIKISLRLPDLLNLKQQGKER